jgi:hypothetical protein
VLKFAPCITQAKGFLAIAPQPLWEHLVQPPNMALGDAGWAIASITIFFAEA